MSPVASQPSASIVSAVLLGLIAVPAHDEAPSHEHLAVLRELDLDPGHRLADGAELDAPQRLAVATPQSRTCPRPRRSGSRSRGRTRAPHAASAPRRRSRHALVEPERRAQRRRTSSPRPCATAAASSSGHLLARLLGAHLLERGLERPGSRSRRSSGSAANFASRAALSFSQIRGTRENRRPDLSAGTRTAAGGPGRS